LLITDGPTHRTLYASPAYERVWGLAASPAGESPMGWTTAIHEEDRARVVRNFLLHAGESQFSEEYRVVRPDGTIRWVRARAVALRERDGQVARIASVIEDITADKMAAAPA
jgi:PAS domain S-box-containing protein